MLIWDGSRIRSIMDDRVHMHRYIDFNSDIPVQCEVFIDGLPFAHAIVVYIEHKKYSELKNVGLTDSALSKYYNYSCVVFIDSGVKDISENGEVVMLDYTEKAREGISYFGDVITDEDKSCSFKSKYIAMEVRI